MSNANLAKSSILIVASMHRSGSSLTTALLQSAGLDIGQRLMPPKTENAKGYFENLDFYEFHETVLESQGLSKYGWTLEEKIDVKEHFVRQAQQIVTQNAVSRLWGWKDPRTTLFLDFWADFLPTANFLFVYRSPWEVVDSLYRRQSDEIFKDKPELAIKFWLHYNSKILNFVNCFPERCFVINISTIVNTQNLWIEAINQKFQINLQPPESKIYEPSLLHTQLDNIYKRPSEIAHYFPEAIALLRKLDALAWQGNKSSDLPWQDLLKPALYKSWAFQDWVDLRRLEGQYKTLKAEKEKVEFKLHQIEVNLSKSSLSSQKKQGSPKTVGLPLVSVCIPTYNGEAFIAETLDSVLSQTYPNLEIIISDDGSSDRTVEIAKSYLEKSDLNFVILNHRCYGLGKNWNFCLSHAQGTYIKFVFQDDLIDKNCIAAMVDLAQQDHEIGLVFSPRNLILEKGADTDRTCMMVYGGCRYIHRAWSILKPVQSGQELLADPKLLGSPTNKIGEPSSVLIKKEVFENLGGFDENFSQLIDVDMWLRILGHYKIGFINQHLSSFRIHLQQTTRKNLLSGESAKDDRQLYQKMLSSPDYHFLSAAIKERVAQKLNQTVSENLKAIANQPINLAPTTKIPKIEPIFLDLARPFWSVMIPTYNPNYSYLEETLTSVLAQASTPDQMQIEVVDDGSTQEGLEEFVWKIGRGRIAFYKCPQNEGLSANWNTCIRRSRGKWVHILHQDDLVLPRFYNCLQTSLENQPSVGAAFSRHWHIDENGQRQYLSPLERPNSGILQNWQIEIAVHQRIQCPSIVVKRSMYEQLGGFHAELPYCLDWEMWQRIAAHAPFWFEPQVLSCWRMHSNSESDRWIKTGANLVDIRRCIDICQAYLPPEIATNLSNQALENWAIGGMITAGKLLEKGEEEVAITQIRESLKCSQSPRVIDTLITRLSSMDKEELLN